MHPVNGCIFYTQKSRNERNDIMAKAKKLPSGSYRVQVFDYKDVDNKCHYKSFTASTKREAEYMAAEWAAGKADDLPENINLYKAITKYIDIKKGVLSPSTIRGYEGMQKIYFEDIGTIRLADLNNTTIQVWISSLSQNLSPKTVSNVHGLLSSTLDMFAPDFRLKTTLPAKKRPELYTPSDKDVKKLLKYIEGTDLEIAVLLAAFGPLRRSEICALTSDDVMGNIITVSKSVVKGSDALWHTKQPKTYGSYRKIEFPDFVIDKIKNKKGKIVVSNPDYITHRFGRIMKETDLPHFRFHDLRHYSASIMHAMGIPDQYIMQRGGWSSDNIMKTVYQNVIDIESVKQNKKINKHFYSISHEISHKG